jgi:hypothetical protein
VDICAIKPVADIVKKHIVDLVANVLNTNAYARNMNREQCGTISVNRK